MRRISLALALVGAVTAAGCGGGATSNSGDAKGIAEGTFTVTIQNGQGQTRTAEGYLPLEMLGGTVTSSPTGIDCAAATGLAGCSAAFPNTAPVVLTATPDTGLSFLGWAGDCNGIEPTCTLEGKADKYVLAMFGTEPFAHPNWSEATVHGPEYMKYFTGAGAYLYNCAACHGGNLTGLGIAPSCAACHPAPSGTPAVAVTGGVRTDPLLPTRDEKCAGCHAGSGAHHQAAYDRYTDASDLVLTIDGVSTVENVATPGTYTSTMTVTITKDGAPYTGGIAAFPQKTFYATAFDGTTGDFNTTVNYNANTAAAGAGPGQYTVRATTQVNGSTGSNVTSPLSFRPEDGPAVAFAYVADTAMPFEAFTVYDNVAHDGMEFGTVDYVSAANDAGCQKCHGTPYRKHGYRVAATPDLDDFAACKVCHYDTRNGSHRDWQCLVDDPAAYAAGTCATLPTYPSTAYKATVVNDTHMSHAMEFVYPQSMGNCVTCHEGKLNLVLTDANFTLETCKSCHPITGVGGTDPKRAPSLTAILAAVTGYTHTMDLYTYADACNSCHNAGGAPSFGEIHSGYNKIIYADAAGTKYSDAFDVAITAASYDSATKQLTFTVTATEPTDIPGLAVTDIVPTVLVSMYGFDTKDFIVGAHVNAADGERNLEWATNAVEGAMGVCDVDGDHEVLPTEGPCPAYPRMELVVPAAGGVWQVRADLGEAEPTGLIDNGTVKRVEIGVMPALHDADGQIVALDAVTRTFDLTTNAFADGFYPAIVKVDGCNACHAALATTFHDADRGGSVVGCRLCHTTLSGGSHLEMQSRSIDSYIHAIHAMQPFDIGDVDFSDPVAAVHYEHHIESTYPNFSLLNCESCHNPGTYEVPTHASSLPGILAKNDTVVGRTLTVAGVVTGPGARACGSCHRVELINEVDAAGLTALDAHTAAFGYRDAGTTRSVLDAVIAKVQAYLEYLAP